MIEKILVEKRTDANCSKPFLINVTMEEEFFGRFAHVLRDRKWNLSEKISAFGCMNAEEIGEFSEMFDLPNGPIDNYDDGKHLTFNGDVIGPKYCGGRKGYISSEDNDGDVYEYGDEDDDVYEYGDEE